MKEIPWTSIYDKIFIQKSWWSDAHIVSDVSERFYRLSKGYKLAGDRLVLYASDGDDLDRRSLVYPICFCYRHFIEVTIKSLIEDYGPLVDIQPDRSSHNLGHLWHILCKVIAAFGTDLSKDDGAKAVWKHISSIEKLDTSSMAFRFSSDKTGQPFQKENQRLDLFNMLQVIETIEMWFDCADLELQTRRDSMYE